MLTNRAAILTSTHVGFMERLTQRLIIICNCTCSAELTQLDGDDVIGKLTVSK